MVRTARLRLEVFGEVGLEGRGRLGLQRGTDWSEGGVSGGRGLFLNMSFVCGGSRGTPVY